MGNSEPFVVLYRDVWYQTLIEFGGKFDKLIDEWLQMSL